MIAERPDVFVFLCCAATTVVQASSSVVHIKLNYSASKLPLVSVSRLTLALMYPEALLDDSSTSFVSELVAGAV